MNRADKLALVQKHAPIFWLGQEESFLPEDCKVAVETSDLYRKGKRVPDAQQPVVLDDIGGIRNSEDCYLKMRDLDMKNFEIPDVYKKSISARGPNAVGQLARIKYGRNYGKSGIPNVPTLPKYYARVSNVQLQPGSRREPFTAYWLNKDSGVFGDYTLVEYFFYYVFNDAWNKHQGDWDSMVHLFIKRDRTYMITHMHGGKWLTRWPRGGSPDLKTWIQKWNGLRKEQIGQPYVIGEHPYIFIAQGAHGCYPTPGFTIHGADIPGIIMREDFIATTDERRIGRICILPPDVSEAVIETNLRNSDVEVSELQFGRWKEPELVENQPWLSYKGLWGEDTKYIGWDGPGRPAIGKRTPGTKVLKDLLLGPGKYTSMTVLRNRHEL